MKRWVLLLFASVLSAKSIPEGYIVPLPLDVFTKPVLKAHFGTLHFDDAVPTPPTRQKIENELRYIQLSNSYFQNYEAVWLEELRRSLALHPNKEFAWTYSNLHAKTVWPKLDPRRVYAVMLLKTDEHTLTLHTPSSFVNAVLLDRWGEKIATLDTNTTYCISSNETNSSCVQADDLNTTQNTPAAVEEDASQDEENVTTEELFSLFENNDSQEENSTAITQAEQIRKLQTPTHYSYLFIQFSRDQNLSKIPNELHVNSDGNLSTVDFVDIAKKTSIALVPKSARFFKLLDSIAKSDVASEQKRKELFVLGIDKEHPFEPDTTMRKAMQEAAVSAGIIAENTPELSSIEALAESNISSFLLQNSDTNTTFDGGKEYTLHIPSQATPWSITLYDTQTKSMMQNNNEPQPYRQSDDPNLIKNEDGSVDLYFAPQSLANHPQSNTILTVPTKRWFALLRFYNENKREKTKEVPYVQILQKNTPTQEESLELY